MKINRLALIGLLVLVSLFLLISCVGNDDDDSQEREENDDDDNDDDDDVQDDDDDDDDDNDDYTGPAILNQENQDHIDEVTHSKRSWLNSVELLVDGVESYPLRNQLIQGATKHINLQYLVFESNDTGYATAQLLADKAAQGVEVNVILDWVSQMFQSDGMGPIDVMKNGGVNVVLYDPIWWDWERVINKRVHVKVLIVDGKEAIVGGLNVGDSYFLGGQEPQAWRDTDVYVTGTAVAHVQMHFLSNWDEFNKVIFPGFTDNYTRFHPKLDNPGETTVRYLSHTPRHGKFWIYNMYNAVVPMAEEYIYLESPYFCLHETLLENLKEAAQNGIDVRILTNGQDNIDMGEMMWFASLYYFQELMDAGIRLFLFEGGGEYEMLHSKIGVIDGVWSTIGSYNLDFRSAFSNSECVLNVHGEEFGLAMEELLLKDMSAAYSMEVDQDFMDALTQEDLDAMEFWHNFEGLMK